MRQHDSFFFGQQLDQTFIKEDINYMHHWPFVREIHRWPVVSPRRVPVMQKRFHDVIIHRNENVSILMKFSSLAALEVVISTTLRAASGENLIKMEPFPFQYIFTNSFP